MVVIYSIETDGLIWYVGQTTNLNRRISQHNHYSNDTTSKYIPDCYEKQFTILEKCDSKNALKREQYWYDILNPLYNKARPGQTKKQYYEKHKEIWQNQTKKDYTVILERKKTKKQCECGLMISCNNMSRHLKSPKHKLLTE